MWARCQLQQNITTIKFAEEVEEIKKSLNFMSEEISKMVKQQATLMGEQRELRTMTEQRDQRIELLRAKSE